VRYILIGLMGALLGLSSLRGDDRAASPAEEFRALAAEYDRAFWACQEALNKATTEEEKAKILREQYPRGEKYGPRIHALAEKNPKDPVAIDALVWVLRHWIRPESGKDAPHRKAVTLLLRDHVTSDRLTDVFPLMVWFAADENETFLRAVLAKNPHRDMRG